NGPVCGRETRPHRAALSKHAAPINANDVVHKAVLNPGDTLKPITNTSHGAHQRRNPLGPLQNRSRSAPEESDLSLISSVGLTRFRFRPIRPLTLERSDKSGITQAPAQKAILKIP